MSESLFTVGIYTLGCKVNQYESQAIAELFEARGARVLPPEEICDCYVINTCTVTAESDRKARQFIRRAIGENPDAYILVTGCLSQTDPKQIAAISGVDYICGNHKKSDVVEAAMSLFACGKKNSTTQISVSALDNTFEKMSISRFDRTRAYIKIEDGCENHCTYCIIPHARGRVRSKQPEAVLSEVRKLTENGCREIVLTGIETASYGRDLEQYKLEDLLEEVDRIPGIGRIRLGSLDPSLMKPQFVSRISALSSLAPHFHLSMQSGSDRILAAMKRKYNTRIALEHIENLRISLPNVQFTTDIIVGFPGESEEDFQKTVEFVQKARFLMIHVFPYSRRAGTPAADFPNQIPNDIKHRRASELIRIAGEIRKELLTEWIEKTDSVEVLFESYENGYAYGHTASFIEIRVPSPVPLHAELRLVVPKEVTENLVTGVLAD